MSYLGFVLVAVIAVVKYAGSQSCTCDWEFKHDGSVRYSSRFTEDVYSLTISDHGRWVRPHHSKKELFQVPGGLCPKDWTLEYGKTYFGSNHKLDLNYWWKWPAGMIHVELKSDFETKTNGYYFQRVEEAMKRGFTEIAWQYNTTVIFDEEDKASLFAKLKERLKIKS